MQEVCPDVCGQRQSRGDESQQTLSSQLDLDMLADLVYHNVNISDAELMQRYNNECDAVDGSAELHLHVIGAMKAAFRRAEKK